MIFEKYLIKNCFWIDETQLSFKYFYELATVLEIFALASDHHEKVKSECVATTKWAIVLTVMYPHMKSVGLPQL